MKTIKYLTIIFIVIFCFLGLATIFPMQTVQSADPTPWRTLPPNPCILNDCHAIKFYLPTAWESQYGLTNIRSFLSLYVSDMNTILSKNTNRMLRFYQLTGIIFTDTEPQTNNCNLPLPDYGFEIWAVVHQSTTGQSYGGLMSCDISNAGVLADMHWQQLYNPNNLGGGDQDYWKQINNMLHELAHVFGAGVGEYYNLATIDDTTGIAPLLNIRLSNYPNDSFWVDKPTFLTDPLLRNAITAGYTTRSTAMAYTQYSNLTAKIISNPYRNGHPTADLNNIQIVATHNGQPMNGAIIKIWKVIGGTGYQSTLLYNSFTNQSGQYTFAWSGGDPYNNYNFLRLIKVICPGFGTECGGYQGSTAKYVSIYDADIVKLINGQSVYTINIAIP